MERVTLEVCVDALGSALAAEQGGAGRVELCTSMSVGGLTPSHGVIGEVCRRLRIPVHVLVRPRPGDFVHTADEIGIILADIRAAKDLGASGVVVGVLRSDRSIDATAMVRLVRAARPLGVTFHRAFDEVAGRGAALETLVRLGVERVLTAGGSGTAYEGRTAIGRLVSQASGRISVMAGGGIRPRTVASVLRDSGAREVHVGSAVATTRSSGRGAFRAEALAVDVRKVKALGRLLRAHG